MNKHRSLSGGALLLLLNASAAVAVPVLPGASGTLQVSGSSEPGLTGPSYSDQASFAGSPLVLSDSNALGSSSAGIGLYPWPSLNLQTTVAAGGNTSASASFDYWIEIFNPAPAASSVPVLVYTNLSSGRPTANDTVHANISLNAASDPPYTPLYVQGICDAFVGLECHFAPANSEETDTVSIPVNEPIHVTLYADANLSSCFRDFLDPTDTCPSPVDSGQSDVFVGMTFQIDPAFLAVDPGYALFASAGLGPDLAVDEPLTVSLFGAGAAMLALLRRRRRIAVTSRPAPSTL